MNGRHVTQLKGIRDIASLINAGSDLATILDRIVYAVCQHTAWSIAGIMKVNLDSGYSELIARFDPRRDAFRKLPTRWKLATSPSLRVAETKTPLIIDDAQHCAEFPDYRADAITRGYHTVVVLPLGATDAQGREMVLSVQSREVLRVTETELAFLTTVAHLGAIAVEKAKGLEAGRLLADRLQRTLEINSSLLERTLAGGSMATITSMVETLLAEPLVIIDLMTQTLQARRSPAPEIVNEHEWRKFVRTKASRFLIDLVQRAAPTDFNEATMIDLAPCGLSLRLEAMVEPLLVDGEVVGGLVIFPRGAARDELDRLMAQEAKLALSVQLLRAHVKFRSRADSLSDLLRELFQGTGEDAAELALRARRLGIDLSRPARLVALAAVAEDGEASPPDHLHPLLARLTARLWPGAAVAMHRADFFVFLPEATAHGERRASTVARRIVDEMSRGTAGKPAVVLGPICRAVKDYPGAWFECARVLALARSFRKTGLLSPDSFGPFADLLSSFDGAAARDFVERTLGRIASYDSKHRARLLETARAFIDTGCRYQACAQRLGIHVSSLRYRIDRLRELFGADLENAETRFAFALALRLRELTEARDGRGRASYDS
jgi:DNA-binding PucR family transcriptional regulator